MFYKEIGNKNCLGIILNSKTSVDVVIVRVDPFTDTHIPR